MDDDEQHETRDAAMTGMHLIRFPNKKEHERGLAAVLDVPVLESLGLPDLRMVVLDEHIKALERAKVKFTYLSKMPTNGKATSSVQS